MYSGGGISLVIYYLYSLWVSSEIDYLWPFRQIPYTAGLGSNTPIWFLFSLFCVSVIYYFISVCFKRLYQHLIIAIVFIFACIVHNRTQILSCGNIALGLVYYHLGYIFRCFSDTKYTDNIKMFLIAIAIFSLILIFDRQDLAFVTLYQRSGSFLLNVPFSLCACYILWFLAKRIEYIKPINMIGMYSLTLFASHRIVLNWIYSPLIMKVYPDISFPIYVIVGMTVILFVYGLLTLLMKKYCPLLIGL